MQDFSRLRGTRVLLDIDEVLAGLIPAALGAYGLTVEEIRPFQEPGTWGIEAPAGRALEAKMLWPQHVPMTVEQFWGHPLIRGTAAFWAGLPPLPWMRRLVGLAGRYTTSAHGWELVSSPTDCPECMVGKRQWITQQFGPAFDRYHLTPYKWRLAQPGCILVDDKQSNVDEFRAAGGLAVLFPAFHNAAHSLADDPMPYVENELDELFPVAVRHAARP